MNLLEKLKQVPESEQQKAIFLAFLNDFKSATRQYSRKQENWFASKSEFRWIRRPIPFDSINPETSSLFALVLRAIQIPLVEYASFDFDPESEAIKWLVEEDKAARDLVTAQLRKKMKCYKCPPTRFTGKFLDDFLKRIQKLIK